MDPLVLDLDGDGIESTGINATAPVMFDIDASGVQVSVGWIKPDDGFLALDRNGNGTIDSGAELFGDATPLSGGGKAADGFAELAQQDSNGDGKVDSQDSSWNSLRVWRDLNQDGTSQSGELFTLSAVGIAAINLATESTATVLVNGNRISKVGSYVKADGSTASWGEGYAAADVDLIEDTFHSSFTDSLPVSAEIEALPTMSGSGMVRDLREAATLSTTLQSLLGQFSQATERADQISLLDAILKAWSDTSTMPTTFTGAYAGHSSVTTCFDHGTAADEAWRSTIDIVERFNGHTLRPVPTGSGPVSVEIYDGTMSLLQKTYDVLKTSVYQALVLQTRLKPLLDQIQITITDQGATLDLSAVESDLNGRIAANPTKGIADLLDFTLSTKTELMNAKWDGWQLLSDTQIAQLMTPELFSSLGWQGVMIKGQAGYLPLGTSNDDVIIGDGGADSLNGSSGSDVLIGAGGNDTLTGETGDDILVGGAGNDLLYGGQGNDTYIFWAGADQDTIYDCDATVGNVDTVRMVGLNPSQVSLVRTVGSTGAPTSDLVIKINGTTDQLTIGNYYAYTDGRNKLEKLVFDDGTTWTATELDVAPFDLRVSTNDFVYRGGPYANANDTYLFAAGSGQDRINDDDTTVGNIDVVRIMGLNPSQVSLIRTVGSTGTPTSDLVIKVNGTTDQLTIGNYYAYTDGRNKIEKLVFDDGTTWTATELDVAPFDLRVSTNDFVYRGGPNANANDTYLFAAGSGQDSIFDTDTTAGNIDIVRMVGLTPSDISLVRTVGSNGIVTADLVIKVNSTTDQLTIVNYYTYSDNRNKLEKLVFDDGAVWTSAELDVAPFDLRDAGNGYISRNTSYGNCGDTYLFAAGSGQDVINDDDTTTGNIDTIKVIGLTPSQVCLNRTFGTNGEATADLVITVTGTTDRLTILNYFSGAAYRVEKLVFDDGTVWGTTEMNAAPFDLRDAGNGYISRSTGYGNYSDTYLFAAGSGQDRINDYDTANGNVDTVKLMGLTPSQVSLNRIFGTNGEATADLVITVTGTTDRLTILNYFSGAAYRVEKLVFDDGTVWGTTEILAQMPLVGTAGADTLSGSVDADVIDGLGGNDQLSGGLGNDVYLFGLGSGQDTINENDATAGNLDTIRVKAGVLPSQVTLSRDNNALILSINGTSDKVAVANWSSGSQYRMERIEFLDGPDGTVGTVWNSAVLSQVQLLGTAGADTLSGSVDADVIDGLGGNDQLSGGLGNDAYLFGLGSGQDTINENDATAGNLDTIRVKAGVLPSQVTLSRDNNALILSINGTSDKVAVANWSSGSQYRIERIEFLDGPDGTVGTVWDSSVLAQVPEPPLQSDPVTIWGTANAETIYGTSGNDVIDAAGGNDTLYGYNSSYGNGNDTYVFGAGSGQDTISDYDTTTGNTDTIKVVGKLPSEVALSRDAADPLSLKLTIAGTSDWIKVSNWFSSTGYRVEKVVFDDGTVWDAAKLLTAPVLGTSAAETLTGTSGDDTLDGGAGNDTLLGYNSSYGNGNDTYVFGAGSGQDTIYDYDTTTGNTDTIKVVGKLPTEVALSRDAADPLSLKLTIAGTSDWIKVSNWFSSTGYRVEKVVFDDGTVWDTAKLLTAPVLGTTGNDTLYGTSGDDTLDGSAGNDTLYGYNSSYGNGNDTYVFGAGSGQDTIYDYDTTTGNTDTIKVVGKLPSEVALSRDAADPLSLKLTIAGTSDWIKVSNWFSSTGYRVEKVVFDDGTVWDIAKLLTAPVLGTSAAETLTGTSGDDTLDGGAGNDTLLGYNSSYGNGNDTYVFGTDSGQDTIYDYDTTAGNTDVAKFSAGIATDQLWFRHVGNNLEVSIIGTADKMTIQNWYSGATYHVEQFKTNDNKLLLDSKVENLVQAMAAFAPPAAGQTTLPESYQSALAPVIAANWQ